MTGGRGRHGRGWWIAVLFMVGSSLFALGAVPWYAEAVGLRATAITFFIGSLFFTSAAFLQYRQAVDALAARRRTGHGRVLVWAPHDLDWSACAVQLAGTLWFNWSTGNAVRQNLERGGRRRAGLAARRPRLDRLPRRQRAGLRGRPPGRGQRRRTGRRTGGSAWPT